ncbi:hypothetical protein MATL_G00004700 [Megalops atlanticus]|uniref:PH domain-containing protein n=1 Tax=Megalops atlanticus TaxID=7932 RepID=A0A9D3QIZ7_MEGAT|nr:hypothetical protein MATL_G00004700 [Megalops atlanticus]
MTPDLLNFKKGWMSRLDDNGEWKKHWFVLTDASLRYYRDLEAEERDDLDGEIDLRSCLKVSEFDTREAVFTLSAMTSGIRRNWVEVLRKSVQPSSSPEVSPLPDSSSDRENPPSHPLSSRSSRHSDPDAEVTASAAAPPLCDNVELSPGAEPSGPPLADPREGDGGRTVEQQRRLEDRSRWFELEASGRDPASDPWDAVVLKKGSPPAAQIEGEIEMKWAEFERWPGRMPSTPPPGSLEDRPTNESLEKEVLRRVYQFS